MLKIDNTKSALPHTDARALVSLLLGVDIPNILLIKLETSNFECALEVLGGLNVCYLCQEGHIRKNCPLIAKRKT